MVTLLVAIFFKSDYATIAGGLNNSVTRESDYPFIGGGKNNDASYMAVVGGGYGNSAGDAGAVVGGGTDNNAGFYSFVGGGQNHKTGYFSVVGGGVGNTASAEYGQYSFVGGGEGNEAWGSYSIAMGRNAKANTEQSCVINLLKKKVATSTKVSEFLVSSKYFTIHIGSTKVTIDKKKKLKSSRIY